MQFLPSTWRAYGVDANEDGRKDPYNPVDAIFAAARYLAAAGYEQDVRRAIFVKVLRRDYGYHRCCCMRLIAGVRRSGRLVDQHHGPLPGLRLLKVRR